MLFDVQVRLVGEFMVATVVGDVDLATLPRLWSALESLDGDCTAIDLRSVDWFDPVCLGALIAAGLRARRRKVVLSVVATGAVADLLIEAGLDRGLDICEELPAP